MTRDVAAPLSLKFTLLFRIIFSLKTDTFVLALHSPILLLCCHSRAVAAVAHGDPPVDETEEEPCTGTIVGIDKSSMHSCVGVFQPGKAGVGIVPNDQGNHITPSYIAFSATAAGKGAVKQRLVGNTAKNQAMLSLEDTSRSVVNWGGEEEEKCTHQGCRP